MDIDRPTLLEFGKALLSHWFSGMSGGLSVPLTIAAFWVSEDWAKIGLGATAFVCIWLAAYAVWKKEREAVIVAENRNASGAVLRVDGPYLSHGNNTLVNRWRMVIHNDGPTYAGNVKMRLRKIEPSPRYGTWLADYPYTIPRVGIAGHSEYKINANNEETYEVLAGWINGEGQIFTEGLDTKTTSHKNYIGIEPDEKWELQYEVTAENADRIQFSLLMHVDGKAVMLNRKT